jgi:hypothetical protein
MTDILLAYGAADGNGTVAQRLYQERFPNRWIPHHSTFASINRWLGETGSLNVNRHDFLEQSLPELLEDVPLHVRRKMWFMHYGAPPHLSMYAREYLNAVFLRGGLFFWPVRSPNLNPLDFFVWGHLRCLVYETTVERENDLLPRIQAACDNLRQTPDIFEPVRQSMVRCCGCAMKSVVITLNSYCSSCRVNAEMPDHYSVSVLPLHNYNVFH